MNVYTKEKAPGTRMHRSECVHNDGRFPLIQLLDAKRNGLCWTPSYYEVETNSRVVMH